MRNPVLAAAVASSVLLAGLVAWHTRGGKSDESPGINLGASSPSRRNSLVERGSLRRAHVPSAAATADELWAAAEQVQRDLHAATTRPERERLLAEFEVIVRQMNALQTDSGRTL